MSQGSVVQGLSVERSAPHHVQTVGLLLVSSLSARQATRQPGPRPAVEPDNSGRKRGVSCNDARGESRRNSRRKVATTSASFARRLGQARFTGRKSGGSVDR
jgi:hypothetical protein